jgi:hypothetical protein
MRPQKTDSKPTMLMLSDCLPAPGGGQRSERSWRLLRGACLTHQVYLAFQAEQPINLVQWRLIASMAERVHIQRGRLRRKANLPIGGETGEWMRTVRFDALLVTSPRLWPGGDTGFADYSFCDFTNDLDYSAPTDTSPVGWLSRLRWPLSRRAESAATTSQTATRFDYALVASERQALRLNPQDSHTVVIPDTSVDDTWARLTRSIHRPALATPAVKVMPVKPQQIPLRKAA